MEGKLPQFNTRIKLPVATERSVVYDGMYLVPNVTICKTVMHYLLDKYISIAARQHCKIIIYYI